MRIRDGSSDVFSSDLAPVTTTSYRLGEDFAVKVGDRVLRRQINPAAQSAVFDQPVRYRARLPLTASYALEKGKPYSLLGVPQLAGIHALVLPSLHEGLDEYQIGRASCRDRVCQSVYLSVVAVS